MAAMYLLFALGLVFVRFFAGYERRFHNGKYIVIRNPKLRMFLLDEMSFFERKKRSQKDLSKMTVSGLIFYIYSLVTLAVSILLHLFAPKTPVEPWEMESEGFFLHADTLNEKLSAVFIFLYFLSVCWCVATLLIRDGKVTEQKWIKVLTYVTSFLIFAAVIFMAFDTIKEFVSCFI